MVLKRDDEIVDGVEERSLRSYLPALARAIALASPSRVGAARTNVLRASPPGVG